MGLYDWLRDRNEAKIKALNKNWLEADFDLLYRNNLAKGCNEEEIERIKANFIEWTELRNELRANGLTPPSPEKTKRIIELELFFNHILEQDRASGGRVMGLYDRIKERLEGHSPQKIEAEKKAEFLNWQRNSLQLSQDGKSTNRSRGKIEKSTFPQKSEKEPVR